MLVITTQNVNKLEIKNEIKNVSDGYKIFYSLKISNKSNP